MYSLSHKTIGNDIIEITLHNRKDDLGEPASVFTFYRDGWYRRHIDNKCLKWRITEVQELEFFNTDKDTRSPYHWVSFWGEENVRLAKEAAKIIADTYCEMVLLSDG